MISTWPEATLVVMVGVFHPAHNLLWCAESWFSPKTLKLRGTNCAKMSCSNVLDAPSITTESMQITNRAMNLRYHTRPYFFFLFSFFFISTGSRHSNDGGCSWICDWNSQLGSHLDAVNPLTSCKHGCALSATTGSSQLVHEDIAILDDMAEINFKWRGTTIEKYTLCYSYSIRLLISV